ncbi:hypothetical protein PM082_019710 [Marasmius tenuissimus]|nr:hypothetical protein PM082_019710 [Marasmius tenuissimus]
MYLPAPRRKIALHEDLLQKPLSLRRAAPTASTSAQSSAAATNETTTQPDSDLTSCPTSPLAPLPEDKDREAGPTRTADPVLICQPLEFSLASSGWGMPVVASMRTKAKDIIRADLNDELSLGEQDPDARQKAVDKLTKTFKELQNHQNDWGAKFVICEQLKSVKNTRSARIRRNEARDAQA